jgi:hypothetical protein
MNFKCIGHADSGLVSRLLSSRILRHFWTLITALELDLKLVSSIFVRNYKTDSDPIQLRWTCRWIVCGPWNTLRVVANQIKA